MPALPCAAIGRPLTFASLSLCSCLLLLAGADVLAYLHTFKGGLFMSGGGSRSTLDESGQFEGMSIQIEVEAAPPSPWFLPARCHRYLVGVSPFTRR